MNFLLEQNYAAIRMQLQLLEGLSTPLTLSTPCALAIRALLGEVDRLNTQVALANKLALAAHEWSKASVFPEADRACEALVAATKVYLDTYTQRRES